MKSNNWKINISNNLTKWPLSNTGIPLKKITCKRKKGSFTAHHTVESIISTTVEMVLGILFNMVKKKNVEWSHFVFTKYSLYISQIGFL